MHTCRETGKLTGKARIGFDDLPSAKGALSALMEKNSLGTLSRFYCLPVEQILIRVVELVVEAAGNVDPLAVEAVEEVAEWGQ